MININTSDKIGHFNVIQTQQNNLKMKSIKNINQKINMPALWAARPKPGYRVKGNCAHMIFL